MFAVLHRHLHPVADRAGHPRLLHDQPNGAVRVAAQGPGEVRRARGDPVAQAAQAHPGLAALLRSYQ